MSRTTRRILAVLCLSALVGLAGLAWRIATQPVVLTLAVGPPGYDDAELAAALAQAVGAARYRLPQAPYAMCKWLTARPAGWENILLGFDFA